MNLPGAGRSLIRLATYNIHSCVGREGRFDPARIAAVINEIDADVVALQEVQASNDDFDVLAFLATQTGMASVAGPTMLRGDGPYGNALLVNATLLEVQRIDLSFEDREPRGALEVVLELNDECFRVIATHLGLRPAERRHQIELLLARLEIESPLLTILMGDLNEWFLWGRPLRRLHSHFGETPAPATFPSVWPIFALDRMWVKPLDRLHDLAVHASPLARQASDHLPLVGLLSSVAGQSR